MLSEWGSYDTNEVKLEYKWIQVNLQYNKFSDGHILSFISTNQNNQIFSFILTNQKKKKESNVIIAFSVTNRGYAMTKIV